MEVSQLTGFCVGIFTYGSFSLDTLQGQTITVLDEILPDTNSSGGIQIVDEDRRLFYIPSANRKSYYVCTRPTTPALRCHAVVLSGLILC